MNAKFVTRKKKNPIGLPNDIKNAPTNPNDDPINSESILMSRVNS